MTIQLNKLVDENDYVQKNDSFYCTHYLAHKSRRSTYDALLSLCSRVKPLE